MAVRITGIDRRSPAEKYGIRAGDMLISINGGEIFDMMDLQFYSTDIQLDILLERDGEKVQISLKKADAYTPLGLEFDTYLIDKQHSCKNKCIFCFVDQLPKGLRKDMYFKDDDERLSFLFGNYITLTNLSRREIDRIKQMKISPINISVHTTDPQLRVFMMKNPRAAEINDLMQEFYDAGIVMNTQIVLCKNVNDGKNLENSIRRLQSLYPQVASCSIVPVGKTRYREGLAEVETFSAEDCAQVIRQVNQLTEEFYKEHGDRQVYLSDEFYLRAGLPVPPVEYYGSFPQIENGVGMVRTIIDSFADEVDYSKGNVNPISADVATGEAMYPVFCEIIRIAEEKLGRKLDITVHKIKNNFFGGNVWVSGLITATDLIDQLKGRLKSGTLLLCNDMLRSEQDMFLDDNTPADLESELGVKVEFYANDGMQMAQRLLGTEI
ncbi:MAG: DUF512 domain-containing protein [Oscillospiraceae bacterium]|nr:DUF512 domain-containing protein [Oscillospiraceae bacterium]